MGRTRRSGWRTTSGERFYRFDSNSRCRHARAVALKMLARDRDSRHELEVLKRFTASDRIVNLLDCFEQPVDHFCLVLEVMWQDALSFCRGFSPEDRVLLTRHISR